MSNPNNQNHINGEMMEMTNLPSKENEDTITEAAYYHIIGNKKPVQLYYIESLDKWGLEREYEDDDALTYLTWTELEDWLEELISDAQGPIRIGQCEYDAGWALRIIDPVAFHQDALEYADSLMEDGYIIEGHDA